MKTFTSNKAKAIRELENNMNGNMVEFSHLMNAYDTAVCENKENASEAKNNLIDFIKWHILPWEMRMQFFSMKMEDHHQDELINIIRKFYENQNVEG